MILYYTWKQKTKTIAECLANVLNYPAIELKTQLNGKKNFAFMFNALKLTFTNKTFPVDNIPQTFPQEIYVCSPIWGGKIAAPTKHFLENAQLHNVKVNLILTANTPTERYFLTAKDYLDKISCTSGDIKLFATSDKIKPDPEVMIEQFTEMFSNR